MKLTVGPLPPAVYWRRRAAAAGGLLVMVVLLVYACASPGDGRGAGDARNAGNATRGSRATPTVPVPHGTASGGGAAAGAQGGADPAASGNAAVPDASGDPGGVALPSATPGERCAAAEIELTVSAATARVKRGGSVKLTLRIKNVATRACTIEVGADAQELQLRRGDAKVWSSDACGKTHGTDLRSFEPGAEAEFYVVWDGSTTAKGCSNRRDLGTGSYRLIGRLGSRYSRITPLTVVS